MLEHDDWPAGLQALQGVDWRRDNPEWKGVVISANGRVVNSRPVVKLSAILIRQKMGLGISSAEQKELDSVR